MKVSITPHFEDVFAVVITEHKLASKGVPKKVGYCREDGSGFSFIQQHGLTKYEQGQVEQQLKALHANVDTGGNPGSE